MDQLRAMRVFARVIDEGGFAKAAHALDIAPAVATRLVNELEEHLGARLIHRTTRRLALTDAGETYLERVRMILSEVDDAEALAGASTVDPRGSLRVLAPPAFMVHQLAQHLPRFRARYPHVTLELTVQGMVETPDENQDVTLMVLRKPPSGGNFIARTLAVSEVVICAGPDYLARAGTPAHPADLAQHEMLLPTQAREKRELKFVPAGQPDAEEEVVTLYRPAALVTTHADTLYASALAGMGIAGLPSFVAADALVERALERVLPQWQMFQMSIVAAMPTRKHLPARTRVFMDFLVETFGGEARDPWLEAAGCPTCPGNAPFCRD